MTAADRAIRISTAAVVIAVAGVAAYVSYRHAYELVSTHGEDGITAALVPLTVDGLIFAASMTMLDAARHEHPAPFLARATLALGIGASITANVAHGINHGLVGAVIAGWPALALVLVYELLMKLIRGDRTPHPVSTRTAVPASTDDVSDVPEADQAAASLEARARTIFAEDLAAGRRPSIRAIRQALHIGQDRARQVQTYLMEVRA